MEASPFSDIIKSLARSCCSPPLLQLCPLPSSNKGCSPRWPPLMIRRPSLSFSLISWQWRMNGLTISSPCYWGSPACWQAAVAKDTAGVSECQVGGPTARQPDTRRALLTLSVAAANRRWLTLCLRAAAEGLLSSVVAVHQSLTQGKALGNPLFTVKTDELGRGLGAILSHVVKGQECPMQYISWKLLVRESKYRMIEKECLAIKWVLLKLSYYLLWHPFTLCSYHALLQLLDRNANEWLQTRPVPDLSLVVGV
ncbi:uncharacterized protein LOC128318201 isoform X2 [Pangasianodon hypophthalmus]|uniref:uncharacterized protein LOC128318201 isoform X2 n=1 Tax=Pangasianodon hypophthalmus TaxID=310915 RepID=UPI000EFFBF26|nr:uncharacterized protein LOC128318201 isoform X2 [Pangasianodon hypophthalmus]